MFIRGAPSFAEPIQGSIAHIIMLNFARKMEIFPQEGENLILLNLRIEIKLFHDQMKYPWGQILMLEKNANSEDQTNVYYAIKSLANVVKIINRENFVKVLNKTDPEFITLWQQATKEVDKFYEDMQKFEILQCSHITASTMSLYLKLKGEEHFLNKSLIKAVIMVKTAWQSIWEKFKLAKIAFNYVLSDKNSDFDIGLSKTKPLIHNDRMIMLSCDAKEKIRLWARTDVGLFKARVTLRPLKWETTDKIITTSEPIWWLYAIKNLGLDREANNYANISREETFTTDY
jgi:hypothetical protein